MQWHLVRIIKATLIKPVRSECRGLLWFRSALPLPVTCTPPHCGRSLPEVMQEAASRHAMTRDTWSLFGRVTHVV